MKYKGSYFKGILIKVLPVGTLLSTAAYCYYFALTLISAGDFTAIVCSNVALIYILSIFWLKEQIVLIRVILSAFPIKPTMFYSIGIKCYHIKYYHIWVNVYAAALMKYYR